MSLISHSSMTFILFYFAKALLISGFLFGYYQLCLRNAHFHGYNRYYLLGITAVSLLLPILPAPDWGLFGGGGHQATSGILHEITTGTWEESVGPTQDPTLLQGFLNWQDLIFWGYLLTALAFLTALGLSLRYIFRLSARNPDQRAGDIRVFMTVEPRTPFSFLNRIFWNDRLDLNSSTGRQIFRHEHRFLGFSRCR